MPGAAPPSTDIGPRYGQGVPLRRRLTSFAIALLINLMILFGLFQLAPAIQGRKDGHGLAVTFSLAPSDQNKASSAKKASQAKATKATTATKKPTQIKPTVEPPVLPPSKLPSNFIPLSSSEFAAADVSKLPSHGAAAGAAAAQGGGAGQGSGAGDSTPIGNGPHGEPLFNAEWFREPTDAELNFYVKDRARQVGAWAEIACQTAARYHVENCEILGDSPTGSGLGRAIADAAWQFLVRPPRVGGKAMIGAWVRIRISWNREGDVRGR